MNTDYISSVRMITQYNDCAGYSYVTIDEDCMLDQKITLTPEVFAELFRASRDCEKLAAEGKGVVTHFDLDDHINGAKLSVHLYICGADDMGYHMAIFEPLRKALYTEDDYCKYEITRKCYPATEG